MKKMREYERILRQTIDADSREMDLDMKIIQQLTEEAWEFNKVLKEKTTTLEEKERQVQELSEAFNGSTS